MGTRPVVLGASGALAGEAGEVLELFQWLTPEQSTAMAKQRNVKCRSTMDKKRLRQVASAARVLAL